MDVTAIRTEGQLADAPSAVSRPYRYRAWAIGLGLAGTMVLALFFRLYRLDTFMHWGWGDEMTYGIEAQRVVHGYYTNLFAYTWDTAPTTYPYLLAFAHNLFGVTLHTGRMVSVVAGVACVPLVALIARELDLSWTAELVGAGLLAVSHWHTYFSRMVLPAIPAALVLLLAVYSVMVAFRRDKWWFSLLAGLACGIAPYIFLANRVLPIILVAWFGYLLIFHRAWVRRS